ncbi:hypothetical protein ACFX2B_043322 [Malus domestica]
MGILDEERANHQNIDQHETSLNPAGSTRSKRSGGRHLLTEGVEGSKAVFHDCRNFLKQRRDNPIHVSLKINDSRVFERLGPLPCPRLATNLGKGQQVIEKHEGIRDSEMFRQTYLGSKYGKFREKSHALDQTFILPRGYGDLRKKASVVHDSTQDTFVLQLLKEVNKLKAERQAEIPNWNQPRPGLLTRRILDTPLQVKTKQKNGLQLYTGREDPIEHLNLFKSTMAYQMHTDEERYDLYTIRQKPDESLREYSGRFSPEYSRCAEVDDKTALKAFTTSLRDCFFKYTINANTWKTYSEVMAQAYNHASAEAMTYQGKPPTTTPYQQVGSGSQIQPNEKTSTF